MQLFNIVPPLISSSVVIGDLPLSTVLFKNQALFPWCVLVPRVHDVSEIYQLTIAQQHQLIEEITTVSTVMQQHFKPTKLNVGSLGNMVSQLHIHVVARFEDDVCWPQGIWQADVPQQPYDEQHLKELCQQLKIKLAIG